MIKLTIALKTIIENLLAYETCEVKYFNTEDRTENLNAIDYLTEKGYCAIVAQAIGFTRLQLTDLGKQELEELL